MCIGDNPKNGTRVIVFVTRKSLRNFDERVRLVYLILADIMEFQYCFAVIQTKIKSFSVTTC